MDYDLIVVKTLERVYKNYYYIIRGETMKVGNVLFVIGYAVSSIGLCMLNSENPAGLIAAWMSLGGLWIMWLGYIVNEIHERRRETNRRVERLRKSA